MDFNENLIKEEVSSFVSSLQRFLPKKKDLIVIRPQRPKVTRLRDVHFEAQSVFPRCFTGARVIVLREVLNKVKLIQQYNYGQTKDSYRYFSKIINKEMEPKLEDDGLLIDSKGSATATYVERLNDSVELRITSKIRDLVSSETDFTLEKEGDKFVSSLSCFIKDVDLSTAKIVGQWFQQLIPEFGVGVEMNYKPDGQPKPDVSVSTRYEKASFALSSTISQSGFQACLFKQVTPDLRISTILHNTVRGFGSEPPTIGIGIHKEYANSSELKVFIDSERCGGFTYQKDILFHESNSDERVVRLAWSALIDRQRRVRFGFGFNLDF